MNLTQYKVLLKRLGLLTLIYTLCRVCFFIYNYTYFREASVTSTLQAFLSGIRFDLSVVFMVNLPFILLSLIPVTLITRPGYQKFLKVLFLIVNTPLLFVNLVDIEFFRFTGKRSTFEHLIGLQKDILDQGPQLAQNYWPVLLGGIALVALLSWLYPRSENPSGGRLKLYLAAPLLIGFLASSILIIRGGLQLKPLRPNHAFTLSPNILGNLVLNTPFSLIATANIPPVQRVQFFTDQTELARLVKKINNRKSIADKGKDNVVILICESFASEYSGLGNDYQGFTPFLDSLAQQGVWMKNAYANGRTSIEALPSILASIPSLMSEPYITSAYQTNEVVGLGNILQKEGYHTSFFHGGKNGTMGFDVFAHNAGFSEYYGKNEYPDQDKDYDGNWGIFDEPFLQFFANKLSTFKQPFVSGVFTLSSHPPYTIPDQYKGKFPKGDLPIHECVAYSDHSIRKFFETAKKQPWYSNTLFVITADHTQMSSRPEYSNELGAYDVPLILFHPSKSITVPDRERICQHVDILPTILDFLNIDNPRSNHFGTSIFSTNDEGYALTFSNGSYNLIKKDLYLSLDQENNCHCYKIDPPRTITRIEEEVPEKEKLEKVLKAYVQYFNNGLIDNNWYKE
jgi:phosphoglycerol transferase MdoB-like AlkP superfamily enzyme